MTWLVWESHPIRQSPPLVALAVQVSLASMNPLAPWFQTILLPPSLIKWPALHPHLFPMAPVNPSPFNPIYSQHQNALNLNLRPRRTPTPLGDRSKPPKTLNSDSGDSLNACPSNLYIPPNSLGQSVNHGLTPLFPVVSCHTKSFHRQFC